MNSAVGSPENTSPMERRRRTLLTITGRAVSGLAVAALMTSTNLVSAQTTPAPAATAPAAAGTAAKKPAAAGAKAPAGTAAATPKSQGSYAIGVSVGENLRRAKVTGDAISVDRLAQGIRDSLAGKAQMSQEYQASIMALIQGARTSAAEPNHAAAAKFLADNAKHPGVVPTARGRRAPQADGPGVGEQHRQAARQHRVRCLREARRPGEIRREPGHSGLAGSADPDEAGCEIPALDSAEAGLRPGLSAHDPSRLVAGVRCGVGEHPPAGSRARRGNAERPPGDPAPAAEV